MTAGDTRPAVAVGPRGAAAIWLTESAAAGLPDQPGLARLRESGVHQVVVTGEVELTGARGLATLAFVRLLRDATSAGIWVTWSGTVSPDLDTRPLCHLPPPSAHPDLRAPGRGWRAAHQAALCYYRLGPGFLQVTDRRPGARPRSMLLNRSPGLDAFLRLLVPGPVTAAAAPPAAACGQLARARLLLRIGDDAVTLPYRLSCRPVPWNVF
jgi:hypothetical protein